MLDLFSSFFVFLGEYPTYFIELCGIIAAFLIFALIYGFLSMRY